ncbi:hypothetical protein, partial [Salmonella sp. s51228]|uniref:hypothetical protein n=1 Tax=Salmonella sp. s51228 TaxID=3159652 RepID=UPI00397FC0F3
YHHVQFNPTNTHVIMLMTLFVPTQVSNEIAHCLFNSYSTNSLLFFPNSLACCISLGLETALVIDIGYSALRITPIFCSNILPSNAIDIPGMG